MKVLLLNPPARDVVIRDYYCSKTTKSNYLFQPIDLLMQSGLLARSHQVEAIDAVARRLSVDQCLAAISRMRPEAVLGLWGAVTDGEDYKFYSTLAAMIDAPVYVSGEVLLDDPEGWLMERPFIAGALLRFVSDGLVHYLDAGEPGPDFMAREGDGVRGGFDPDPPSEFSLGGPLHELFGDEGYHFSFAGGRRFATVLTDFGCPYKCSFCVMSGLGYRTRPVAEVVAEWRGLHERGVRELFVSDQCFGCRRERALELCAALAAEVPGMGWTTFTRADFLDEALLGAMKGAGCHTAIMGVESADPATLEAYQKGLSMDKVAAGFRLCREQGVRSVATFIIGLPEDDEASILATMKLARELAPDFVSYNVAVPRAGTSLAAISRKEGLADPTVDPDQAGDHVSMKTRALTRREVARLKKRAVLDFYLRPSYLWRRIKSARSPAELISEAREGASLILKNL